MVRCCSRSLWCCSNSTRMSLPSFWIHRIAARLCNPIRLFTQTSAMLIRDRSLRLAGSTIRSAWAGGSFPETGSAAGRANRPLPRYLRTICTPDTRSLVPYYHLDQCSKQVTGSRLWSGKLFHMRVSGKQTKKLSRPEPIARMNRGCQRCDVDSRLVSHVKNLLKDFS